MPIKNWGRSAVYSGRAVGRATDQRRPGPSERQREMGPLRRQGLPIVVAICRERLGDPLPSRRRLSAKEEALSSLEWVRESWETPPVTRVPSLRWFPGPEAGDSREVHGLVNQDHWQLHDGEVDTFGTVCALHMAAFVGLLESWDSKPSRTDDASKIGSNADRGPHRCTT